MVNEFTKVAGYKINIQKLVAFLYTNNKLSGREIKKSSDFILILSCFKSYCLINSVTVL